MRNPISGRRLSCFQWKRPGCQKATKRLTGPSFCQRQPQARTGGHLPVLFHAVELLEYLLAIFRAEAHPAVFDFKRYVAAVQAAPL